MTSINMRFLLLGYHSVLLPRAWRRALARTSWHRSWLRGYWGPFRSVCDREFFIWRKGERAFAEAGFLTIIAYTLIIIPRWLIIHNRILLMGYKGVILPRAWRRAIACSGLHRAWLRGHMMVPVPLRSVCDRKYWNWRKGERAVAEAGFLTIAYRLIRP